ncbi:MAG: DUF5110 domain-containing protein [Clostridia bacterium]|nr:DUF5110 domain-containing protein [Clostridia bacterium]
MSNYLSKLKISTNPVTDASNTIVLNDIRLSVLSPYMLRVEIDKASEFCDQPTQSVIDRSFNEAEFTYEILGSAVIITTSSVKFIFDTAKRVMESITLDDGRKITDYKKGNLKGTCRTLDGVNGRTSLNDGIISLNGVAILDDSDSLILCDDGRVKPRENAEADIYYFAYGYNYREAIKDLFNLTGKAPLIPRFTLGNWWSRYKAYTQDEYTELMQRFIDEKIPVTIATIDMDWHWVDVVKRFGKDALDDKHKNSIYELFYNTVFPGWTGYSWNTDLFPDHKAFLTWLKNNGFKITMNLHPASGCKFYEDAYNDFCEFMEIDKNSKQQIRFDITDEKFIEGYFRFLHHPHEEEGVDFWWIDWQQGKNTSIKGLDPLWALNHYHSIDISRDGKRPLILSRFAGAGSQRYPLGFSGDTVQTWKSLEFQPYFTSTASNIGYSWWSHDIGGHCRGYRDDELYLRWVQYGVFSPINRLHSTSNEFMGKEPWMYNKFVENTAVDFLRFRHRLIPYIYSMNKRTASEGRCLIEPMYYGNPRDERAYKCPNEYYFGSELIVCPITEKVNTDTGLAGTEVYLPKGRYTDIFTGRIYRGNTLTKLYRDQSTIPVLAKEGAIIPLSINDKNNSTANPENMELLISRGNNSFTLYEDDGETLNFLNGAYCETEFCVKKTGQDLEFSINAASGDISVIPKVRNYTLTFIDISGCNNISVKVNGKDFDFETSNVKNMLRVDIKNITPEDKVIVNLNNYTARKNPEKKILLIELFSKLRGSNEKKQVKFTKLIKKNNPVKLPIQLKGPVAELEELYY